jgi:Fe-S-cluster containining protein
MATKRKQKTEAIEGAEFLKFRCNRCGNCCRLRIPLTDEDARRLIDATGMPPERFIQFFGKSEFGSSPGQIAWIKFGPRERDKKAMCVRETYDRCYFLRPKKGCLVYEHRPIVCREHPFDLTLDDEDREIELIEMNDVCECSRTLDGKVNTRDLIEIHKQSLEQDERYFAKVRRWNRRKTYGTQRDFLKYLGLKK